MTDFPRVLIIGQSFTKSGGGITLANLFKGWPVEKLAVVATEFDSNEDSNCDNNYLLGYAETSHPWPFRLLQRKIYSGPINPKIKDIQDNSTIALKSTRLRNSIKKKYLMIQNVFGIFHYVNKITLSDRFIDWVNEFHPDIIYTQLASLGYIRMVSHLNKIINKPIVIHIMDDWPKTIVKAGLFSSYWSTIIEKEFRDLMSRAAVLMSICQAMSDEYKIRYNQKFIPFHNPIDLSIWKNQSRTNWAVGENIRILYAGRLSNVNIESLLEICEAISDLITEGHNIVFEIRTSEIFQQNLAVFTKYSFVEIHPYIKYNEMPMKLKSVDLLIIPLDFNKQNQIFTQFSMPGKTSDYMASGTPVLVYAPPQNAIVKYAKEWNWGYTVEAQDKNLLKKGIRELITNVDLRDKLGRNAIDLSIKNHDATVVKREFQDLIRKCVNSTELHAEN